MVSLIDPTWLRELPKVELHVHLEGSMSVATIAALSERHNADLAEIWPEGLPEQFSFDGFPDFARQFFFGLSLLRTGADLATATEDLAIALVGQNVRYAEVTTTAFTHLLHREDRQGMAQAEYRDGLNEGRRRARNVGVELGWVIDIPRDIETPADQGTIGYLEGSNTPDGLVAIGLGGYEVGFPAAPYADDFARARAIGLHSVPHAGETEGPHSIRSAIEDLGAERIGHGVRCLEDPALVADLIEHNIMLEVCPTSNNLLRVIDSIEDHPLRALVDAGLRVSINTDDPGWFATDLVTELEIAAALLDAAPADLVALQVDALEASFAPDAVKTEVRNQLADVGGVRR